MLLDTHTLNEQAYQVLRELIMARKLAPGQRLDVEELAKNLGISVTPVKDALGKLALEGFIEVRPRRGTYVAELHVEDLNELFEVRLMIELFTAEAVIQNGSAADVKYLRNILEEMESLINDEHDTVTDPQKWLANDHALHLRLLRLARNERIVKMYDTVKVLFLLFSHSHNTNAHATHREHTAIVDAFEQKSVHGFRTAVQQHIINRQAHWRRVLGT